MIPLIEKAVELAAPVVKQITSPLAKWVAIGVVILVSNLYTWHWATLKCERDKAEAIAIQAREFSEKTASIVASREEVLRQRNEADQKLTSNIIDLQKKLVIYERNAKKTNMPVPPDSVSMFNAISGLLPAQNDLPSTDATAGKSHESPEARIETTQLLLAYVRAYSDSAEQLATLWQDYSALVQSIRREYALEK